MENPTNSGQPSKKFNERFELQAKERNTTRPLLEKLLQQNKSSALDVAREEAEKVNELVDKNDTDSFQHTADSVIEGKEFGSEAGNEADQKRIKFQEMIRSKYPDLEKSFEHGLISPGYLPIIIDSMMTENNKENFIEGLRGMISDKIDSAIRANDLIMLETLLTTDYRNMDLISAVDVAQMPIELISKPNLKPKVIWILQSYLRETVYPESNVREVLEKLQSTT